MLNTFISCTRFPFWSPTLTEAAQNLRLSASSLHLPALKLAELQSGRSTLGRRDRQPSKPYASEQGLPGFLRRYSYHAKNDQEDKYDDDHQPYVVAH